MKPIKEISVEECYKLAEAGVRLELTNQIVDKIKSQIMAVEQLRIKANNATTDSNKLDQQLKQKEDNLSKIRAGDWSAIPDSAKERDEKTQQTEGKQ